MFSAFLSLFRGNTTLLLGGGIITSVLGFFTFEHLHIVHLESELTACHTLSVALENSNHALLDALDKQNQAVSAWKQEAQHKSENAGAALAIAQKESVIYTQKAAHFMQNSSKTSNCKQLQHMLEDYYAH